MIQKQLSPFHFLPASSNCLGYQNGRLLVQFLFFWWMVVNFLAETNLMIELAEWLTRSEVLWRQKSRELWLKFGDKNSRFFHLSTVIQRRWNNIDAIKIVDGTWITNARQIRHIFQEGFKNIFIEEQVDFPCNLENLIQPSITQMENTILSSIPNPDQIKHALFQMEDQKA